MNVRIMGNRRIKSEKTFYKINNRTNNFNKRIKFKIYKNLKIQLFNKRINLKSVTNKTKNHKIKSIKDST